MVPGGPTRSRAEWAELVRGWFPHVVDARVRQVTWPAIEVHRDYVVAQLELGVTAATIHQRLRDEQGLDTSVASFRRWVRANLPEEVRRSQVRVLRPALPPGQEAQVDYGRLGRWLDPTTGVPVIVWAFVMVLSCSRHMFVYPVIRMDQRAWTEAHVEAFRFFGGVPARIVPDNLKTGVDRPDLYDPKLNRSYAELAEHYGVLVDPARAGRARDKARVERPMPYVRDSFWRGRQFASSPAYAPRRGPGAWTWPDGGPAGRWTGPRQRRCSPRSKPRCCEGCRPDRSHWPRGRPARSVRISTSKVGKALYSVPWRLIGQRVDARETWTIVQIFHNGQLAATHARAERGRRTDMAHYPPEKIAFAMRTPTWCRRRAREIGPACSQVIATLLEVGALYRLRSAQGVLGLADKHGAARLEAACAKAIAAGDPSYRTVKGILTAGAETDPPAASTGDGGAAAHLHGPDALFGTVLTLPISNSDGHHTDETVA
jgi:transposase